MSLSLSNQPLTPTLSPLAGRGSAGAATSTLDASLADTSGSPQSLSTQRLDVRFADPHAPLVDLRAQESLRLLRRGQPRIAGDVVEERLALLARDDLAHP